MIPIKMPTLATVYLDKEPVGLMGDPMPLVSKIVVAGGKRPDAVQVLRGRFADDERGRPLRLDETIDRTAEPTVPIYLVCVPKRSGELATNLPAPPQASSPGIPPQYVDVGPGTEPRLPGTLPPLDEASHPSD